jgi:hypothetical protein
MRLAATLTTMRDAARQPVELRGTLRDPGELPRDVVILDVSVSGFRAELPGDVTIEPGTRVRIAASAFGVHEAIAVRGGEEGGYGFAFTRPIAPAALSDLDGDTRSSVTPFPNPPLPFAAIPALEAVADEMPRISARASLAIMVGISCALWIALAAIVAAVSFLA